MAAGTACTAPLRARFEATRVTLVNGADMESFGGIEMAGPSYFGPEYNGIQRVLITEFEGAQPVTAMFNVNEKKGVAQLELGVPTPAHPANGDFRRLYKRADRFIIARSWRPADDTPVVRTAHPLGHVAPGWRASELTEVSP